MIANVKEISNNNNNNNNNNNFWKTSRNIHPGGQFL